MAEYSPQGTPIGTRSTTSHMVASGRGSSRLAVLVGSDVPLSLGVVPTMTVVLRPRDGAGDNADDWRREFRACLRHSRELSMIWESPPPSLAMCGLRWPEADQLELEERHATCLQEYHGRATTT